MAPAAVIRGDDDGMTMPRLKVGLVARIFNNMPVWVAEDQGFFADAGLDASSEVLYGVGNVTEALRAARVDVAIGTPESVLADPVDTPAEQALQIAGGNARTLANGLIARRGIRTVEQLRGGTVGVSHPTEGTGLLVAEMLDAYGLRGGRDYRIAAVGVAEQRSTMLRDGTIDAALQTPPHKYDAEDRGYVNLGDIARVVPEYQFTTINVRRMWGAEHRDTLRRVLAALSRATRWMYGNPEGAVSLATAVMGTSPDHARRDYAHFRSTRSLDPGLRLSESGMAKVIEVMTKAGTLVADTEASRATRIELSTLPSDTAPPPARR
jgi:ABC-type nitrate/sulfonate/bicarbonate transport system substrate-binding protein